MFGYCKWLLNILEIPILNEAIVNKVFKDNPNFISSLSSHLIIFQNP